MAWDISGRYFYRSRWVSGRPVREYVGTGLLGQLASAQDEDERAQRIQQRARERVERDHLAALDAPVTDLCLIAETLAKLALLSGGYRQHDRGHWRRRRANA